MTEEISPNIFIQGAIPMDLMAALIGQNSRNTFVGAYSIFLGQVRSDESKGSRVKAVEYTTYAELAIAKFQEIKTSLFDKYPVTSLHVHHSLGKVSAGEICFFVLVASGHRREAIEACNEAVERIKAELPIWGMLLFENDTIQWKHNNQAG